MMATSIEPEGAGDRLEALLEEGVPMVEASGDAFALYLAALARGMIAHNQARMDDAIPAYEEAVAHGRRAGLPHLELWLTRHRAAALLRQHAGCRAHPLDRGAGGGRARPLSRCVPRTGARDAGSSG